MDIPIIELSETDTFRFSCSSQVPCFNTCCRDLTQFLTPYDILRLRKGLGLSSTEFLARYTTCHDGPESGLPMVTFDTRAASAHRCPFVSEQGCRVYPHRPSSCRAYPLMRVASRCRETGRITERFFLIKEPHCRGFEQEGTWSVRQWTDAQDLALYNEMNDRVLSLISLKNRLRPGPLEFRLRQAVILGLYDLDSFRRQLFSGEVSEGFRVDRSILSSAGTDDVALLQVGLDWVQHALMGDRRAKENP